MIGLMPFYGDCRLLLRENLDSSECNLRQGFVVVDFTDLTTKFKEDSWSVFFVMDGRRDHAYSLE